MNRIYDFNELAEVMEDFFMSAADDEHDEDEMLDLLDGIDWKALYQALLLQGRRVYEFIAGGEASSRMNYRSRDLFGQRAVCLDEDIQFPQNTAEDNQVNTYSYELWLLEDFSLVVTSCYRMKIGGEPTGLSTGRSSRMSGRIPRWILTSAVSRTLWRICATWSRPTAIR